MATLAAARYLEPPWADHFAYYSGWCTNTTAGPRATACAPPGAPTEYECAVLSRGNRVGAFAGVAMRHNASFTVQTAPGFPLLSGSACPQYVVDEEFNSVAWADQHFYGDVFSQFVDPPFDFTLKNDSAVFVDMPSFVRVNFREIGVGGSPP